MTFAMFDEVRLLVDIPAASSGPDDTWPVPFIPAGTEGMVMELEGTPTPMVEWLDAGGSTIDVLPVAAGDLELVVPSGYATDDDDPAPTAA